VPGWASGGTSNQALGTKWLGASGLRRSISLFGPWTQTFLIEGSAFTCNAPLRATGIADSRSTASILYGSGRVSWIVAETTGRPWSTMWEFFGAASFTETFLIV